MTHVPVLLNEVLKNLSPSQGEFFIDCTAGEGGHSLTIGQLVAPNGKVLSINLDSEELILLKKNILENDLKGVVSAVHGNFIDLERIVKENNFPKAIGILFDLGFSSWQLEHSGRGFTFQKNEPLDMRLNPKDNSMATAADIVNGFSKEQLVTMFKEYSQETYAEKIATAILKNRKKEKINTTGTLVNIISQVVPRRGRINPATKVFLALRIAVNDEFLNIKNGLEAAYSVIAEKGKIVVITFHSGEDRLVKNIFRNWVAEDRGQLVNKKVIRPSYEEVKNNPRSRSAKLRIFQVH